MELQKFIVSDSRTTMCDVLIIITGHVMVVFIADVLRPIIEAFSAAVNLLFFSPGIPLRVYSSKHKPHTSKSGTVRAR